MSAASSLPAWNVKVYLYDLTQGMAKQLSLPFLGKQIDGVWHTGIVVYGHEYFYGGGIQAAPPGMTIAGRPTQMIDIGTTSVPQSSFHDWLRSVSSRFSPATYSLLSHNCNNFTDEACRFLTSKPIPAFITGLPDDALNTPMGQMLKPMIMQMEQQMKGNAGGGMIPWSTQLLDLPTSCSNPDTFINPFAPALAASASSNTASSPVIPITPSASPSASSTSSSSSSPTTSTSSSSSSSPVNGSAPLLPYSVYVSDIASSHSAHTSLTLTSLQPRCSPLLSTDTKLAAFHALIKTTNSKLSSTPSLQLTDPDRALLDEWIKTLSVTPSATASSSSAAAVLALFHRLLSSWPLHQLFPVLAIYRLLLLRADIATLLLAELQHIISPHPVLARIINVINSSSASSSSSSSSSEEKIPVAARIMALCCLSNLFCSCELGRRLVSSQSSQLVPPATSLLSNSDQSLRLMGATLLYNIVIASSKNEGEAEYLIECLSPLSEALSSEKDAECAHRMLLSLANLIYGNSSCSVVFMSMDIDFAPVQANFASSTTAAAAKIRSLVSDVQIIVEAEKKRMSE